MARNFAGADRGANIAFTSDLPPAAGMSSSSALMVAIFFALADINDVWNHPAFPDELKDPLDLAGYLGTVENGQSYGKLEGDRGVGTFGGSEDHTAILCARAGYVSQYAYCPVRFEREIPLPSGCTFAVASSGVAAEKTGAALGKYNRASRLAAAVAELWRRETGRDDPHLAAALSAVGDAESKLKETIATAAQDEFSSDALLSRLEHFVTENGKVIPAAGDALLQADLDEFGRLVDVSQQAAEQLLGNQVPETSCLASAARENGAIAASAFGAGFGGSVWAMIETERVDAFLTAWHDAYRAKFPQVAARDNFFATAAGPAMFRLE
jgi:galactokinase